MKNKYLLIFCCPALFAGAFLFPNLAQGQLSLTFELTQPTCFGYTNGSAEAMPTGGVAPYNYMWSNNQGGKKTFGLGAGNYAATVTDATGATATGTATLTQPPILQAGIAALGNICDGNDGDFMANATGGTSPFSYEWSNGAASQTITNPNADYHFVTVTDANGCQAVGGMNIPQALAVSVHTIDVLCALLCDGSAEAIIAGGTGPYSFLWNTGATSQVIFPLPPGDYTVTVADGNGCTKIATGIIIEPPAIVITANVDNPCNAPATASVNATGGIPPFTYQWSHGVTGQTATGLTEGIYFVTVTDANDCKKDHQINISNGAVVAIANSADATCVGLNDGSANAVVTSGLGPYSFLWNNGGTVANLTGLAPGTYSVTVTDGAGCTDAASTAIGASTTLLLNTSNTAAGCAGSSFGTATVSVTSGGEAPYSFLWNNGQTAATATGLAPGSYSVTVTDAQGCKATAVVNVLQSNQLTILVQIGNASCHNTPDGDANVAQVSSNGLPPFSYLWSNGDTTAMVENLLPGAYSLTLTDAQGCTGSVPVNVTSNASISADFEWDFVDCPTDTTEVQLTQTVTFLPPSNQIVAWEWAFDAATPSSSNLPNPLVVVTDSVFEATLVVENATGCRDTVSHVISISSGLNVEFPISASGCVGDTLDLSAIFNPSDNLTFEWTGPTGVVLVNPDSSTVLVVLLEAGTFDIGVLASSAAGCNENGMVNVVAVNENSMFDPSLVTHTQCDSTTVDFQNGNPSAAAFEWYFNFPDDLTATSTLPDPSYTYPGPGTYTVAFVPMSDCVADTFFMEVTVAEPALAAFSFSKSDCSDTVTVSFTDISITPQAITSWFWQFSTGQTSTDSDPDITLTQSQTGMTATLTIEYETGCSKTVSDTFDVRVFNPSFLQDTVVACLPNPSAELNPAGIENLTYLWSPPGGLDDPNFWNPTAMVTETTVYNVTISDESGADICVAEREVTVFVPSAIGLAGPEDVTACEDGTTTLMVTTSVNPVDYLWSSLPDFGDTISQEANAQVAIGEPTYFYVMATDEYGCSQMDSVLVGSYAIEAQAPGLDDVCKGDVSDIVFDNLAADDTLTWMPFDPTGQPLQDSAIFVWNIVNAKGCTLSDSLIVNVLDLSLFVQVEPALDTIVQGQSVGLSVISDFDVLCNWTPGSTLDDDGDCRPTASPLETTTYTVELEDVATGCRASGTSTICVVNNLCEEPMVFVPNAFTPDGDGLNDVLYVRGYNVSRVLIFAIYDRWGEKVFESHSMDEGWDGHFNGQASTGDVFAYYLKVECFGGEEFFKKGNVTVIR